MQGRTVVALLLMVCAIGLAGAAMDTGDASLDTRVGGGLLALGLGFFLLSHLRSRASAHAHRPLPSISDSEPNRPSEKRRSDDLCVADENLARTKIEVCEELPEVEQAKVLLSFGRTQEAAQALAAVSVQPADALDAWLKVSAARTDSTMPTEHDTAFNVEPSGLVDGASRSLEDYPHILREVIRRWGRADCAVYLDCLLLDTRSGKRKGFPITVAEEIILLRRLLKEQLA